MLLIINENVLVKLIQVRKFLGLSRQRLGEHIGEEYHNIRNVETSGGAGKTLIAILTYYSSQGIDLNKLLDDSPDYPFVSSSLPDDIF